MALPTYDHFIEPILRHLAAQTEPVPARDVHEAAARTLRLSEEDMSITVPSGQLAYKNRAGWAHDRLKRAGYSRSVRHGMWELTESGRQFAAQHPSPIPPELIADVGRENLFVKLSELGGSQPGSEGVAPSAISGEVSTQSPDDRLESAVGEIREAVGSELLDLLMRTTPRYFETVVLDLLHKLGYGASRDDLRRVGGSGDAGIDGVISLDKLGLEKVYVQAKRWSGPVGRPEVQGFYGALAGQRAQKGVFLTTSSFSAQARDFARSVERIILVDGRRLVELMMDHEVGVTSRIIRLPRIDSDYFDE